MTEQASNVPARLPPEHDLNVALRKVRDRALAAVAGYEAGSDPLPSPLAFVKPTLQGFDLLASDALGDRGFVVDVGGKAVLFNATYLGNIVSSVIGAFTTRYGFTRAEADAIAERAVGLYVFHELFHINQNFIDHELAGIIKDAFGPDELSKLDVYADVIAAHCQAVVEQAEANDKSWRAYLKSYASNLTLSYNVLTGAFSSLQPHKKRRALGLITSRLLVEKVLERGGEGELSELAICPIFTSVARETGHIIALVGRETGWEILFHVQVNDVAKLEELWHQTGPLPPEELIALMIPLCDAAIPTGLVRADH